MWPCIWHHHVEYGGIFFPVSSMCPVIGVAKGVLSRRGRQGSFAFVSPGRLWPSWDRSGGLSCSTYYCFFSRYDVGEGRVGHQLVDLHVNWLISGPTGQANLGDKAHGPACSLAHAAAATRHRLLVSGDSEMRKEGVCVGWL